MNVFISTPEGERTLYARIDLAEDLAISYDRAETADNTAAVLARFSKPEKKTTILVSTTGSTDQVIETIAFYLCREIEKTIGYRVLHLARHGKKARTRKKNKKRIYEHLKKHIKEERITEV